MPRTFFRLSPADYAGLHRRYEEILKDTPLTLSAADDDKTRQLREKLQGKFDKMMKSLFKEEGASLRIDILSEEPTMEFINTHADILNTSLQEVRMSDEMRQRLEQSNWVFSGMKTFHELNEAFPSLIDDKGDKKPFERFLNDVRKIDETYNKNYLRAEYNFVQASSQMAARWEDFADHAERYYLQYRTAGDDRVRPEHAAMNGITLPMDDSFWKTYYPPNGWNCRCAVVQVRKSKQPATPHDEAMAAALKATSRDKKGMFRFNPGLEKRSVPAYNPYTNSKCKGCNRSKMTKNPIEDNQVCEACMFLTNCSPEKRYERNNQIYESLKKNKNYTDVQFDDKTGGIKAIHTEHNFDKKKGYYEIDSQNAGFKNGHVVILGKEDHSKFIQNNCDGLWNSIPFEIAGAETATANNIRNALKHCARKTDSRIAVIYFPNDNYSAKVFNDGYALFYGLKNTSQYKRFDLIYCIHKENIIQIKKPSE